MKQPYKVQNRTSESRRVKFVKNGGTVSFPKTPTASFIENSREAGFCLTAITPLPDRDNATNTITLTSHPMGTDGRVSLFINDTLIESKRFVNKSRIADRQTWFNSEFGAYATYSGKEVATFTTALVSPDTYRFVFEDDDLDYVFAGTTNAAGDVNPTLIVEQYRLAFNIMNNKIEISCDGAHYESPYMTLTGDWQLEINGEKYTTLDTPIEEMLALIAQSDISVVYEGQEPEPEPEEVITDYTLTAWYNNTLERFEGFVRPTEKVLGGVLTTAQEKLNITSDLVFDGKGRWHYNRNSSDVAMFAIATYRGELADPEHVVLGEHIELTDFTTPAYRKADGDIIPTYGREYTVVGDGHLYFKIGNGEIQKEQIALATIFGKNESVNLNMLLAVFADAEKLNRELSPLGKFFMTYTNSLGLLGKFSEVIEKSFVDFTFLTPKPGHIPLAEPVTITLYRGLSNKSDDLFSVLFPNVVENYITFTATARLSPKKYVIGTTSIATTTNEVLQRCAGPFGNSIRIINATDIDNLTSDIIATEDFLPKTGYTNTTVDYSKSYFWYMNYSESGDQLAVYVIGSITSANAPPSNPGDVASMLIGFNRTAPTTFEKFALTEFSGVNNAYPTINAGVLGWNSWSSYQLYGPTLSGSYEYLNDWGFGEEITQLYEIGPNEQFVITNRWDSSKGISVFKVHHLVYNPSQAKFTLSTSSDYIPNQNQLETSTLKPLIVNVTDTASVVAFAGKLLMLKKPTGEGGVSFTTLESTGGNSAVVLVDRTGTEVFMIITDNIAKTYRFVAMSVTDFSMREITSGTLNDLGGYYGRNIGSGKTVFLQNDRGTDLVFNVFDLEIGLIKSVVFQPK